jgi:peptide chain release factor 1
VFASVYNLHELEEKYGLLEKELLDPEIVANKERYRELSREFNHLAKIIGDERRLRQVETDIGEYGEMLPSADEKMREEIDVELARLNREKSELEHRILLALLPADPLDGKNIIMEIRAGTGGEEAALFAADLFRMYTRYCERRGWKVEVLSSNETGVGGIKEIIYSISGRGVFSRLKFEKGVHRVQRIPITESGGRIHTSAVTVAVLPEPEETDIEIANEELRVDVFRARGHGGQHVNTTDSAVRITHLPTGLVVTCQDEKSQLKNKDKALKVLRARLFDQAEHERKRAEAADRRSQVGSGDRSERIRTYNFPQNRLTDHRIGLTLYKLDFVMDGDLEELIESLTESEARERLARIGIER